jgi:hypothetical protein
MPEEEMTMKLLSAMLALGAGVGVLLSVAPVSAEMAPYRYCMIGTPNMGRDCTFATLQQCQLAASAGVGFCQENSAYIANARRLVPAPSRR